MKHIFLALIILFLSSCAKQEGYPMTNGTQTDGNLIHLQFMLRKGYDYTKINSFYQGDDPYAVVESRWLQEFYTKWNDELWKKDLVKWDPRFDCNRYASHYVASAQLEFYRKRWGTNETAQALAIGEIWYRPERQTDGGSAHAIVAAITEKGLIFIEPQTGKEVYLSEKEIGSIYLKKF